MRFPLCLCVSVAIICVSGCGRSGPPYSPKQALKTFQLEPGFHIETFLSEPDIQSPVAMEFDENGRIYVVEDPGYPLNVEGKVGRIKLIEDTDGDGRPDRVTVFADKLTMPTGVMRWRKGILVTDAPNVWYFEDTNGDGKADVKQIVLTGFAFSNPQHTVNNPVYGLDNWIYLAHEGPATAVIFPDKFGDPGSNLRFPDRPEAPSLKPERRNVRFRPHTYQLEYLSGSSQFGHSFDEWGHHFTLNNSNHARHEVIAAEYLKRNPDLPVANAIQDISDHGAAAEVYPITRGARFEMLTDVGQFTSACSLTLYLGGAFPASLGRFSLVAEPAHDIVHRDLWSQAGSTFTVRRDRQGVEFLASTDAWFRPVNFYIGPDGAIYLIDYYRQVIEHPEWMATHTHHSPDLYKGQDRGRIYRIAPDGASLPLPKNIRLSRASDEQLVLELANPNIWWRRTAQRLLVDRKGMRTAEALVRLFETNVAPLARLHALWTLDGLGKLDTALIDKALGDREAGVRENAIILAEPRLATAPVLGARLIGMENDSDSRVRFQLLCTLGSINSPASHAMQDRLIARDMDDRWMQVAALSASSDRALQLFHSVRALASSPSDARANFFRQVAAVIGARQKPAEIRQLLAAVAAEQHPGASWWRAASLDGLAQGLRGRHAPAGAGQELLLKLFEAPDETVRRASLRVLETAGLPSGAQSAAALRRASAVAGDRSAEPNVRADSIRLLALSNPGLPADALEKLVDLREPDAVQAAAVHTLGRAKGEQIGAFLLKHWRAFTPPVRNEAADAMFLDPARVHLLVDALKTGDVQPWTLAFRHKRQLIMSRDVSVRDTARPLLEQSAGEREKVLQRYQAALDKKGDAARGRQVFERVCAKCHKLAGIGHEVGPDLGTIRTKPAQFILPDILMPNRSIAQGYESYVVEIKSGGTIEGVMGPQTPTTITIRHEDGKEDVIRREDIKQMYTTNLSAMPEDLEKQISVGQMADLLQFLKTAR